MPAKVYTTVKRAVSKFQPPAEDESSDDASEAPSSAVSASPNNKGLKITGAKKAKKGEEIDEEEPDTPTTKAVKGNDGKRKTSKPGKDDHLDYKPNQWNKRVPDFKIFEQLDGKSDTPNFSCGVFNNNREIMRACRTGNKKLLQAILSSKEKVSSLNSNWGIEEKINPLQVLCEKNNIDMIKTLVGKMEESSNSDTRVSLAREPEVGIETIQTGFNDKYAYGVYTRKVNVSRGGRQGNNAFLEDDHTTVDLDNDFIDQHLAPIHNLSVEVIKNLIALKPDFEHELISNIPEFLFSGNVKVAEYLLTLAKKRDGFGINEYYIPALTGNLKSVSGIKKQSIIKKAYGIRNTTPLHFACLNPKVEVLKHLYEENPESNVFDNQMSKLVHYAACCESVEPLKFLLSKGSDPRETNKLKFNALHFAAYSGRVENVKLLLKDGRCVPTAKEKMSRTALHIAVEMNRMDVIEVLLESGVPVKIGGKDRVTALHIAAYMGNVPLVRFLIDKGAKVNLKDKYKRTPLLLACKNGRLEAAVVLLQHGAPFEEPDSSGNTPLHYACAYGYPEIIDALFKAGANPNSVNSWNLTPTAVALLKTYFSCVRKMLENPLTDVNCKDDHGRTLLSNSIKSISAENYPHVLFLLKDKKADPNIADTDGLTPLDYLCKFTWNSLCENDLNKLNKEQERLPILAEKRNWMKKYITLFMEYGASINHVDKLGQSCLMKALISFNVDAVEAILSQKDVNINQVAKDGRTAFHLLGNLQGEPGFESFATIMLNHLTNKVGKSPAAAGEILNRYSDEGFTVALSLANNLGSNYENIKEMITNYQECQLIDQKIAEAKRQKKKDQNKPKKAKKTKDMDEEADEESDDSNDDSEGNTKIAKRKAPRKMVNYDDDDNSASEEEEDQESEQNNEQEDEELAKVKAERAFDKMVAQQEEEKRKQYLQFFSTVKNTYAHNFRQLANEDTKLIEGRVVDQLKLRVDGFINVIRLLKKAGADLSLKARNPVKKLGKRNLGFDDLFGKHYFDELIRVMQRRISDKVDAKSQPISKKTGGNLLHLLIDTLNEKLIKFLIEECGQSTTDKTVQGQTPLFFLIKYYSDEDEEVFTKVFQMLISKNASISEADLQGETPLLYAVRRSNLALVDLLLKNKANPNCANLEKEFPLMIAVSQGNVDLTELLLNNNADPNMVDKNKRNCLHWSINQSSSSTDSSGEIQTLLISKNVNPNALDARGRTPLHYAFVKIGDPFIKTPVDPIDTVAGLLSKPGVQVNIKDQWGNTPLNYAAQRGSLVSALYLLKQGAELENKNNNGLTPLQATLYFGHESLCIFLVQKGAKLTGLVPVKESWLAEVAWIQSRKAAENQDNKQHRTTRTKMPRKTYAAKKAVPIRRQTARKAVTATSGSDDEEEPEYESSESVLLEAEPIVNELDDEQNYIKKSKKRSTDSDDEEEEDDVENEDYDEENEDGSRKDSNPAAYTPHPFFKMDATATTFSIAIRRNWQSVAFLMLEYGFDLSLAILDSFSHRKYNYVYMLLLRKSEAGVYLTANSEGQNLTHLFAQHANKMDTTLFGKIHAKLESKKLDYSSKDSYGRNSLHYASKSGSIPLVKILLTKGIDVNQADSSGMTPFGHIVKDCTSSAGEFAELAKKFKLDLNKRFKVGGVEHTALTYIASSDINFDYFVKIQELGADVNAQDSNGRSPLIHLIMKNDLELVETLVTKMKADAKVTDKTGKTVIHYVVTPSKYGSFQNVKLLQFLAKYQDVNKVDRVGRAPISYAKELRCGILTEALKKLKATDVEEGGIKRAATSLLGDIKFEEVKYDFEADFEKFVEKCKAEESKVKDELEEKIPVDPLATGNYEVVYDGADAYDAYMVKVDISYGCYSGNTFYKMQILHERVRDIYVLFTRWGRVGTDGQYQQTPFNKLEDARKEYCSVFKSKSGNLWEDRHNFKKVEKRYRLVPYAKKAKFENFLKAFNYKDNRIARPQVEPYIFKLVRRLCNSRIFVNALKNVFEFALPMRSLTKERIEDAKAVLDSLEKAIEELQEVRKKNDIDATTKVAERVSALSSEYYELIPSSRYTDRSIPPITNQSDLDREKKMIENLAYFEVALKLIGAARLNMQRVNPIDYIFNCLDMKILRVDPKCLEYEAIEYTNITLGNTSRTATLEICSTSLQMYTLWKDTTKERISRSGISTVTTCSSGTVPSQRMWSVSCTQDSE
jgi:ankyrin repeat protein/predicted DNA-binding WGR domain protein